MFNYIALCNASETISLSKGAIRPRQLAYILQDTDFFTYNLCLTILTGGKQLRYRLTDATFF